MTACKTGFQITGCHLQKGLLGRKDEWGGALLWCQVGFRLLLPERILVLTFPSEPAFFPLGPTYHVKQK